MKQNLTRVLLIASGIAYILAIIAVGKISLENPNKIELKDDAGNVVVDSENKPVIVDAEPPKIEDFYLTTISLIGTALAIHTGRLLQIEQDSDDDEDGAPESNRNLLQRFLDHPIIKWIGKVIKSIWTFDLDKIPEIATILYITGLVVGVYFYFREDRSPASAELLKTSWTSLLGLFAGVWASDDDA